jgi:multidrug transporter EmrE-like cation transporter
MNPSLSTKLAFFGLIIIGVLLEVAGDVFFKKWALEHKNVLLYIGLLIYFSGAIFWALSLKFEYLSRAISIFTILNLIIAVLAGVLFFKENLSITNKLGIALGIISVILLEL